VPEQPNGNTDIFRKLLPITTVILIVVLIYVGWIVFSRWQERRDTANKAAAAEVENAKKTVEAYGGSQVTILAFTLNPGAIHAGESVQACYSVSNAKIVRIDPKPEEETWPSLQRCVHVKAQKSTPVTLTAEDAAGHSQTKSLPLTVE
jgi:preprotein translocase subunit YajC